MKTKLVLILIVCLGIIACSQGPETPSSSHRDALSGKLTITGSSTVAPLIAEMAKAFERLHPDVRIDVQTGGSSRGIADVNKGLADIGMISRALKPNEHSFTPHTIARDGIGIIIHRDNPLNTITSQQVKAIYLGETQNWQSVNGINAPITVINKAEGRSTLELFLTHFALQNSKINASIIIGDNEQGVKTIIGNPQAIGYVSIGTAEYNIQQGAPIKLLSLDDHRASSHNVASGNYPLSRTLNLIVSANAKANALTEAFINYAQSPEVNSITQELNFVPL